MQYGINTTTVELFRILGVGRENVEGTRVVVAVTAVRRIVAVGELPGLRLLNTPVNPWFVLLTLLVFSFSIVSHRYNGHF